MKTRAVEVSTISMKNLSLFARNRLCAALGVCALASVSHAQIAPDAGQTLQQLQPSVAPPRESQPLLIEPPASSGVVLPGGAAVILQSVSFVGNTAMPDATLRAVLGEVVGQSFDLAGLRGMSDRISAHYRAHGYPFARSVLPPQDLQDGQLRIEVIEGRYGQVQALSDDPALAAKAQPFLQSLAPGALIEAAQLERASLILDDLPGIKTSFVMRPGADVGAGDLDVNIRREKRFAGDVGLDNQGNRFTGEVRAHANLQINSPFLLGDQISIRTLASDEKLRLGAIDYSAPLGGSGLRATLGYAYTSYVLGKEFASSQAHGVAKVVSTGLSYPLIRSQQSNLTVNVVYQAKNLQDNQDAANVQEHKTSKTVPILLQFDRRDDLGGGGISYGSVGWTQGKLKLGANLEAADSNNTQGSFGKLHLDVVRLQSLPAGWMLMGRLSAQWARKNLDSSEKMGLGGASGVRAYPMGEANGDEGSLVQLEMRYTAGAYAPYVFFDRGSIKTNAKPPAVAVLNERTLSGAGFGLRYQRGSWSLDGALAWRVSGGVPQADTSSDPRPRVWVSVATRF